ncbi:formylglycine-generating enzyme family protein [Paludibacterium purpuratum]|uniref:Formylglycine-generating enzyme required for sulfatase activity n=1 Tax=Paludibacterium purpuratum TaxID=1144873 RepID=A0A4R7B1N7_9NEIS|nr:formylglycine-generating enzyme family protein [Paludibacterium purpuratum]TDR76631.1 formylglycine-generating enzyme required for sulfatase activity [Paludibacterium purpuratum]
MRAIWLAGLLLLASIQAGAAEYRPIPGGEFRTALPPTDRPTVSLPPYALRALPVTQGEFLAFVRQNPQWRRDRVPALFAARGYLDDWAGPTELGKIDPQAPVTRVSWYAARAYCASEGATLPSWYQWEFAAAADASRADARDDPAWRQAMLDWYASPQHGALPPVGSDRNVFGIYDLHRLIYEWVEDYNGLFVNSDSRTQGVVQNLETCGAAALSLGDRQNYAILMRIAMLAALDGNDTLGLVGFRCAKPVDHR